MIFPNSTQPLGTSAPPGRPPHAGATASAGRERAWRGGGRWISSPPFQNARHCGSAGARPPPAPSPLPRVDRLSGIGARRSRQARTRHPPARRCGEAASPWSPLLPPPRLRCPLPARLRQSHAPPCLDSRDCVRAATAVRRGQSVGPVLGQRPITRSICQRG